MFNKDLETLTSKQAEMNNTIAEMKTTLEGINSRMSPVYFFFNINLFIYFWLRWVFVAGATLHCGVQASHCGGFSCCGARALGMWASVVVVHGLSSCGAWA